MAGTEMKVKCCFCSFSKNERGVWIHMKKKHKWELGEIASIERGRHQGDACPLCHMIHADIVRPGWGVNRKELEKGTSRIYYAESPSGLPGGSAILSPPVSMAGGRTITMSALVRMCRDPNHSHFPMEVKGFATERGPKEKEPPVA